MGLKFLSEFEVFYAFSEYFTIFNFGYELSEQFINNMIILSRKIFFHLQKTPKLFKEKLFLNANHESRISRHYGETFFCLILLKVTKQTYFRKLFISILNMHHILVYLFFLLYDFQICYLDKITVIFSFRIQY